VNDLMAVLADLAAESAQLDDLVADLSADQWQTVTTPEGWTIAHQIGHLHWTDLVSVSAMADGPAFASALATSAKNPTGFVDDAASAAALIDPADLLQVWRVGRTELAKSLSAVPAGQKISWFGPPMSPMSMATARLMETWAHGQDVAESLGVDLPKSDRVRHVCHLGVRTFSFAHAVRGETAPQVPIRVELVAPSGQLWTWGPAEAVERVTGSGWDFALLATRRRHRDDVQVVATGEHADHWLDIVQTFAGSPGNDPLPLARRRPERPKPSTQESA